MMLQTYGIVHDKNENILEVMEVKGARVEPYDINDIDDVVSKT